MKTEQKSNLLNAISLSLRRIGLGINFKTTATVILLFLLITGSWGCNKKNSGTSGELNWNYEYNDAGYITKITDPGGKATIFNYEYFPGNGKSIQIVEKVTAEGKISYQFNETGQLLEMLDKAGIVQYDYDQSGNLKTVKRNDSPSLSYTYNSTRKITSISLSNGYSIEYSYDFLDRLTAMKTPAGEITYSYHTGDGIIVRQLPNGIRTQYKYLPDGKLESITYVGKDDFIITKYTYAFQPDGLISDIAEWTPQGEHKLTYEYDEVQRLIAYVDRDGEKTEYKYDEFGNRIEVSVNNKKTEEYTYDWCGRMLTANGNKCEYDISGNLISSKEDEKEFSYNSNNQLQKGGNITYEYAGDGLLMSRKSNSHKTYFINNPLSDIWQPLLAVSDNETETFYIWEGNSPIATIINGKATFFLTDHLSSVRGIADENGNLTRQLNYSPFGKPDHGFSVNNFEPGFTGLYYEPKSMLYLTKARAYNPGTGRFLQIDPLHQVPSGTQKDLSLFAYCGGDPINYIDLKGTQTQPDWLEMENYLGDFWSKTDYYQRWRDYGWFAQEMGIWKNKYNNNDYVTKVNIPDYGETDMNWRNLTRVQPLPSVFAGALYAAPFYNALEFLGAYEIMKGDYSGIDYLKVKLNPFQSREVKEFYRQNSKWKTMSQRYENLLQNYRGMFLGIRESIYGNTPWYWKLTGTYTTKDPKSGGARIGNAYLDYLDDFICPPVYGDELPSSNVGGVYLGGADKVFEGLGQLSGIGIDESNGKLVLISEDKGEINLPSLRIDDVVTVFRSVYQRGEAPYVSIDPNPQNPRGPIMLSRHSEATKNSYVGWILFEADRIMKAYSLGEDNITKKVVQTKVAGYDKVLNAMFAVGDNKETWERFWIVPSSVKKDMSTNNDITLFEVPLMVKTQKMILRNGKLEPAANGKISKGAQEFASWFTTNFDRIAGESYSLPPKESGFTNPVPVFKELQRIALITAIAEQLRDQGVEFPFWMRSYEVRTFQTPESTPAHKVVRQKSISVLSVYGGVNLSPSDDRIFTTKDSHQANCVSSGITGFKKIQTYLKTIALNAGNKKYHITALPGAETKDLGACIINETDLSLNINGENYLSLTRKYNSFVSPIDKVFGKTWSLDLPYLEKQNIPVPGSRKGDAITMRPSYHLITPLNSISEKIDKLYIGDNKNIGFKTSLVVQDNVKLHFNENGSIVAYEDKPFMILYNRDNFDRIFQIVGFWGNTALADIKLKYDKNNRLLEASGSNGESVAYNYSNDGTLSGVRNSKDIITYQYQKDLVTGVKLNDEPVKQYKYNDKGQLLSEIASSSIETVHKIESVKDGFQMSTFEKVKNQKEKKGFFSFLVNSDADKIVQQKVGEEIIQYDYSYRPLKQIFGDGSTINADYSDKDFTKIDFTLATGEKLRIRKSNDNKNIIYSLPDGTNYHEVYDENGQLISLYENTLPVFQQKWNMDGTLNSTSYENHSTHYEYSEEGVLQRVLITPSESQNPWSQWISYSYDWSGNLVEVSDYSGMKTQYGYDKLGNLSFIGSNRGIIRIKSNKGPIDEIETSWGLKSKYYYDSDGNIEGISDSKEGSSSNIKFKNEQISEIRQFNGANYSFSYSSGMKNEQLIKRIKTPVNNIEYDYDDNDQLVGVNCNNKYRISYKYDKSGRLAQISMRQYDF